MKNQEQCPACASYRTIRWDQRRCGQCNAKLFRSEDDFVKIKEDCIYAFYVWFAIGKRGPFQGWVHSSHLENPTPYEKPMELVKPDKNYGKRPLPAGCSAA